MSAANWFRGALQAKIYEWKAEAKRIHDLAQKERSKSGKESLMAQSVRYWNCADEMKELMERDPDLAAAPREPQETAQQQAEPPNLLAGARLIIPEMRPLTEAEAASMKGFYKKVYRPAEPATAASEPPQLEQIVNDYKAGVADDQAGFPKDHYNWHYHEGRWDAANELLELLKPVARARQQETERNENKN